MRRRSRSDRVPANTRSEGDVAGEGVSEQMSVTNEFSPRIDATRDAAFEPRLGEVAGGDPEALHGETQ